jgi:cytochrome c oxidase cbb3-type subunit III
MSNEELKHDPLTQDPLLNHNYDGIQELDNPLPGWWLGTFYITIVFAAFYFSWHQIIGDGHLVQASYEKEWTAMQVADQANAAKQMASTSDESLLKASKDPAVIAAGKDKFTGTCASCHGPDGGGLIGPNLTDAYWINGDGKPMSILKIIKEGVTAKGMPAWGPVLSEGDNFKLAAYIISLQGSSPSNPKDPQGEKH